MIKIALRQNLKYPLQLLIWSVLRDIEGSLFNYYLKISDLLIKLPLMFFGEFLAGLIIYQYQKQFFYKKGGKEPAQFKSIELIQTRHIFAKDNDIKIMFLMFSAAFFDFFVYKLYDSIYRYPNISGSIERRQRGLYTIFNALFFIFVLRFPILRHQKYSLIILGICLLLVAFFEFIFQEINIFLSYGELILSFSFIIINEFFGALVDSIGKYLFEYNKINPFSELLFEGLFGFLISCIYCLFYNPFDEISKFKKVHSISDFIFLIFGLILYTILSGGKNCFRVMTTKTFTPMTTTYMSYILNPFYMIFYFSAATDFMSNGKRNYLYFFNKFINFFYCLFLWLCL